MINQEFKALGRKYCLISRSVAGSQGGSKLRVMAHACTVSALSNTTTYISKRQTDNFLISAVLFMNPGRGSGIVRILFYWQQNNIYGT